MRGRSFREGSFSLSPVGRTVVGILEEGDVSFVGGILQKQVPLERDVSVVGGILQFRSDFLVSVSVGFLALSQ